MRSIFVAVVVLAVAGGLLTRALTSAPEKAHRTPKALQHVRVARPPARPPQFIIASFDGSGGARLWTYWRSVAKHAHAHFSFFISGVYLVDWAHHDVYLPPDRPRGESAIGFAPDAPWIAAMRRQIALGYREGHEIGTHYNGHFCGAGGVATWTARDWSLELDEFNRLLFGRRPTLPFGPREIVGGRTPCLEGNFDALYPVLARRGFRYDASQTAVLGTWPAKRHGIWSFPLLELPFVGHTFRVVSMDYNFMANQGDKTAAEIEEETYRTFWNGFPRELPRKPRATLARQSLRDLEALGLQPCAHALPVAGVPAARRALRKLRRARELARRNLPGAARPLSRRSVPAPSVAALNRS